MKQMPVESFFLALGRPILLGDAAHLGLFQLADREQGLGQLRLVEPVQEVALVLGVVQALEQLCFPAQLADSRIVTGGDLLGAQAHRMVQEGLELDLGIAQHVGVGRAAGLVLAQKGGEDAVLVVGGEIDMLDLDAEHVGHGRGVDEIDVGRAVLAVVVIFPVLHEDADHLVAACFRRWAVTAESTPPDRPTTTRCLGVPELMGPIVPQLQRRCARQGIAGLNNWRTAARAAG